MIQNEENFIQWFGEQNMPPLALETKVHVKFRDGTTDYGTVDEFWWDRDREPKKYEIVGYRKAI